EQPQRVQRRPSRAADHPGRAAPVLPGRPQARRRGEGRAARARGRCAGCGSRLVGPGRTGRRPPVGQAGEPGPRAGRVGEGATSEVDAGDAGLPAGPPGAHSMAGTTVGAPPRIATRPTVSVIVCGYTEDRWDDLSRAVRSIHEQTEP